MSKLTETEANELLGKLFYGIQCGGVKLTPKDCQAVLDYARQRHEEGVSKGWDAGYRNAEESAEGEGW